MFIKLRKFIPYNGALKDKARKLRNEMTPAENKLWYEYLRNHKYNFLRQKPLNNYIVDFYCQKLKLVIEVDGETHLTAEEKSYDAKRTQDLNKYGIKVLRFWNADILNRIENIVNLIEEEIKKSNNHPNPLL